MLRISFSSHSSCFICHRKNERLYQVKQKSIIEAYIHHNIMIKSHARTCCRHIDYNGFIKTEEFLHIPLRYQRQSHQIIYMLDALSRQFHENTGAFEKFKDISIIDNFYCLEITGWSKEQFIHFASYITSVYDTAGRSKEELIAIYRFWLRKGIDQTSIAMFKNNSSQRKISHYLEQIRIAIYNDFVPYFLGTQNKTRKFFLKHNNKTTNILYNLNKNELAIIVDGTYVRLEKSANNQFQYYCWSQQKLDLLIKPFLICCSDGYLIDCYGPFKANQNDATILDYILKTDKSLLRILKPSKTIIFLDRGFRDMFHKLRDEYQFLPKIPTCKQLNNQQNYSDDEDNNKELKQLTTKQATESRLVTKVRFIIEKQNNILKNKKSLDNIRNTVVGHIMYDYRITCSMYNFSHKSCCPDGKNAEEIARKIKKRSLMIKSNKLKFLLRVHLGTKSIMQVMLSDIKDFPKLSAEILKNKIFFGSYQLKQSLSYLKEIVNHNKAFVLTLKYIQSITDLNLRNELNTLKSKIIGFEIISRHKRSEVIKNNKSKFRNTYKVFIQYVPEFDSSKAIKSYICSCLSGRKTVGCCVHVATVLYYLSYAKYHDIKLPAEHLNSIFVDFNKMEASNSPRYVKNKRTNYRLITSEKEIENETDSTDDNNNDLKEDANLSSIESNNSLHNNSDFNDTDDTINFDETNIFLEGKNFVKHVPPWSAIINFYERKNIYVSNTCTIDYYLFSFWVLSKIKPNYVFQLSENVAVTKYIKEIIINIDILNWDYVRELWVVKVMNLKRDASLKTISLFGTVYDKFIRYISTYQKHNVIQRCNETCNLNNNIIYNDSEIIFFKKENNQVIIETEHRKKCRICKSEVFYEINFSNKPNFLIIESRNYNGQEIYVNDLPKQITINNYQYKILNTVVYKNQHFIGIFLINNRFFVVDDIGKKVFYLDQNLSKITRLDNYNYMITNSSFYYLI